MSSLVKESVREQVPGRIKRCMGKVRRGQEGRRRKGGREREKVEGSMFERRSLKGGANTVLWRRELNITKSMYTACNHQ